MFCILYFGPFFLFNSFALIVNKLLQLHIIRNYSIFYIEKIDRK